MLRKVNQIRLRNLETLIKESGSAVRLARAAGISSAYLSQVRNQLPTTGGQPRCIGKELAAKLEKATDRPTGWMDQPHADSPQDPDQAENAWLGPWLQGLVPVISWVQAGNWHEETAAGSAPSDDMEWVPCPVKCSQASFALRVRGESMQPRFHEGDLIFVEPGVLPEHGRFVVARLDHSSEATFKQFVMEGGKRYLKAINPNWPNPIIEVDANTTLCGVIVFIGRFV